MYKRQAQYPEIVKYFGASDSRELGLLGAVVNTKHQIDDVLKLQDRVERDSVDGQIDPTLRNSYRQELEEAREAIETAIVGKVSPQQLTAVDGVVNFNYNIAFAPRQFYKKLILKVTPKMQYPDGEEAMEPLYFQGERVKGTNYPVVEYKGNTLGTYNLSFPYRDGMQKLSLIHI